MTKKWSDKYVPPEGPTNTKIVLIGESPGATEERENRPFVGGAGKVLDGLLADAGIIREECYLTNVVKHRPVGNNFSNFYDGKEPTEFLLDSRAALYQELKDIRPNVIVPLGNEALKAVTGLTGITKHRGSILGSEFGKTISTFHPAAVLRQWTYRAISLFDLKRVKEHSNSPFIQRKLRVLSTMPSYNEIIEMLECLCNSATPVAFDIETETNQITCIGFSNDAGWAICIPFWYGSSGSFWTLEQEVDIWLKIKKLLEGPVPKIAQNAQYDICFLADTMQIHTQNLYMDTMIAAHTAYPELPKGLDFLTSVYTDQPYYKDRNKMGNMNDYFEYNCLDACCTWEVAVKLRKELEDLGMWGFYQDFVHETIAPLMKMSCRGVRIDLPLRDKAIRVYKKLELRAQKKIDMLVGHELNINSHPQMIKFLYEELGLPKQFRRRKTKNGYKKTETADEEALETLQAFQHRTRTTGGVQQSLLTSSILNEIQKLRASQKISSTYLGAELSKDKRLRTSYTVGGTETGRLSSHSYLHGVGTNLQNVPKGIARRIVIPDEGKVFLSFDLSQAEARVVAYLAGEESLIRFFEAGGKIHRKIASDIFRIPEDAVSDDQYRVAKKIVHASHYGMGPVTFAKETGVSSAEAKRLLNAYFARYTNIRLWHLFVVSALNKTRVLETPLGRKRLFMGTMNESMKKDAYAFVPQSTVADVLNMGLIEVDKYVQEAELLLQAHDSVVLQCVPCQVKSVVPVVRKYLTRLIDIKDIQGTHRTCVIPVDVEIGRNWDALEEYEEVK